MNAQTAQALIEELLALAYQYRDDLNYPPAPDSRERRLARIAEVIAKAEGGTGWQADCPQCVASKFACDAHFISGSR